MKTGFPFFFWTKIALLYLAWSISHHASLLIGVSYIVNDEPKTNILTFETYWLKYQEVRDIICSFWRIIQPACGLACQVAASHQSSTHSPNDDTVAKVAVLRILLLTLTTNFCHWSFWFLWSIDSWKHTKLLYLHNQLIALNK